MCIRDRWKYIHQSQCGAIPWIKKVHLRNQSGLHVTFAETTHVVAAPHRFPCVVIPRDVVIYYAFHRNPFRGFGATGGSKSAHSHYFGYCLLQQLVLPYNPWNLTDQRKEKLSVSVSARRRDGLSYQCSGWLHFLNQSFAQLFSLSPKTNLTPEFRSQSEIQISWTKTGAKIATDSTRIVDFCLTRKIFTLYLQFCASLSMTLRFGLRK